MDQPPADALGDDSDAGPDGVLAIVAGRGALPREIATARAAAGKPFVLIIFPGAQEPWMLEHPNQFHRFEKVGRLFSALAKADVTHLVFAGAMDRPKLRPWNLDWAAVRIIVRALGLLRRGDDAMLRGFAAIFEEHGIKMISAAEVLGRRAMVQPGPLGRYAPGQADFDDVVRGKAILDALGPLDVGQAVVVARGLCLGVEALGGTDALLAEVARLPAAKRAVAPAPSGVVLKMPKVGQDDRFDVPAIGPDTVRSAADAGLAGIVVAEGATHLLDAAGVRAEADRRGLFVYGLRAGEP